MGGGWPDEPEPDVTGSCAEWTMVRVSGLKKEMRPGLGLGLGLGLRLGLGLG